MSRIKTVPHRDALLEALEEDLLRRRRRTQLLIDVVYVVLCTAALTAIYGVATGNL